ncbi:MAG: hypothetical protein HQK91_13530 [Nitrospirae bacterium]|nr:hypothetical protein [Nitrospirota bacterium]
MDNPKIGIKITAHDEASPALQNVEKELHGTKEHSEGLQDSVAELGETWHKFVEVLEGYLALEIGKEFIKTASAMEDYKNQLSSLTGSQQKGNEVFEQLHSIIEETPLQMRDLVKSYQVLQASGLEPTTEMLKTLGATAMASGRGSEGIEALSMALGRMETSGKVTSRALMEFQSMGINAFEILNEKMQLGASSMADVDTKSVSAAEAVKVLLEALKEQKGDYFEQTKDSWSTLMDSMKKLWEVFQEDVMNSGLFDMLKKGIKEVAQTVKDNEEEIKSTAAGLGWYVQKVLTVDSAFIQGYKTLGGVIKDALDAISKINPDYEILKSIEHYKNAEDKIHIDDKWNDFNMGLEEKIRQLDNKSKTPQQIQADTSHDITNKMNRLWNMPVNSVHDSEEAVKLAKDIEKEAGEIQDVNKQKEILVNLQKATADIRRKEQLYKDEEAKKLQAEREERIKDEEEATGKMNETFAKISDIETKINNLTSKPAIIKIEAETTEIEAKLAKLTKEYEDLAHLVKENNKESDKAINSYAPITDTGVTEGLPSKDEFQNVETGDTTEPVKQQEEEAKISIVDANTGKSLVMGK